MTIQDIGGILEKLRNNYYILYEVSWRFMSVIVLAGTIGAGKSSLTAMLSEHLGSQAFYESIDDNEVLPLFYADPEQYAFYYRFIF